MFGYRVQLLIFEDVLVCAVLQKVSEVESVCAEKLRDIEAQLNTARREHTKAGIHT